MLTNVEKHFVNWMLNKWCYVTKLAYNLQYSQTSLSAYIWNVKHMWLLMGGQTEWVNNFSHSVQSPPHPLPPSRFQGSCFVARPAADQQSSSGRLFPVSPQMPALPSTTFLYHCFTQANHNRCIVKQYPIKPLTTRNASSMGLSFLRTTFNNLGGKIWAKWLSGTEYWSMVVLGQAGVCGEKGIDFPESECRGA